MDKKKISKNPRTNRSKSLVLKASSEGFLDSSTKAKIVQDAKKPKGPIFAFSPVVELKGREQFSAFTSSSKSLLLGGSSGSEDDVLSRSRRSSSSRQRTRPSSPRSSRSSTSSKITGLKGGRGSRGTTVRSGGNILYSEISGTGFSDMIPSEETEPTIKSGIGVAERSIESDMVPSGEGLRSGSGSELDEGTPSMTQLKSTSRHTATNPNERLVPICDPNTWTIDMDTLRHGLTLTDTSNGITIVGNQSGLLSAAAPNVRVKSDEHVRRLSDDPAPRGEVSRSIYGARLDSKGQVIGRSSHGSIEGDGESLEGSGSGIGGLSGSDIRSNSRLGAGSSLSTGSSLLGGTDSKASLSKMSEKSVHSDSKNELDPGSKIDDKNEGDPVSRLGSSSYLSSPLLGGVDSKASLSESEKSAMESFDKGSFSGSRKSKKSLSKSNSSGSSSQYDTGSDVDEFLAPSGFDQAPPEPMEENQASKPKSKMGFFSRVSSKTSKSSKTSQDQKNTKSKSKTGPASDTNLDTGSGFSELDNFEISSKSATKGKSSHSRSKRNAEGLSPPPATPSKATFLSNNCLKPITPPPEFQNEDKAKVRRSITPTTSSRIRFENESKRAASQGSGIGSSGSSSGSNPELGVARSSHSKPYLSPKDKQSRMKDYVKKRVYKKIPGGTSVNQFFPVSKTSQSSSQSPSNSNSSHSSKSSKSSSSSSGKPEKCDSRTKNKTNNGSDDEGESGSLSKGNKSESGTSGGIDGSDTDIDSQGRRITMDNSTQVDGEQTRLLKESGLEYRNDRCTADGQMIGGHTHLVPNQDLKYNEELAGTFASGLPFRQNSPLDIRKVGEEEPEISPSREQVHGSKMKKKKCKSKGNSSENCDDGTLNKKSSIGSKGSSSKSKKHCSKTVKRSLSLSAISAEGLPVNSNSDSVSKPSKSTISGGASKESKEKSSIERKHSKGKSSLGIKSKENIKLVQTESKQSQTAYVEVTGSKTNYKISKLDPGAREFRHSYFETGPIKLWGAERAPKDPKELYAHIKRYGIGVAPEVNEERLKKRQCEREKQMMRTNYKWRSFLPRSVDMYIKQKCVPNEVDPADFKKPHDTTLWMSGRVARDRFTTIPKTKGAVKYFSGRKTVTSKANHDSGGYIVGHGHSQEMSKKDWVKMMMPLEFTYTYRKECPPDRIDPKREAEVPPTPPVSTNKLINLGPDQYFENDEEEAEEEEKEEEGEYAEDEYYDEGEEEGEYDELTFDAPEDEGKSKKNMWKSSLNKIKDSESRSKKSKSVAINDTAESSQFETGTTTSTGSSTVSTGSSDGSSGSGSGSSGSGSKSKGSTVKGSKAKSIARSEKSKAANEITYF